MTLKPQQSRSGSGVHSPDNDLNRKIIRLLQDDGRMPFNEIAKILGVSEGTIRNRVNGLRANDQLRFVAMVDPVAGRYKTDAMIGIRVASGCTPTEVAERLGQDEMVVFVLWVSGTYDLMIEVVSDSREDFQDFLETQIHGCRDIDGADVMLGIRNFKNQFLLKSNWNTRPEV